MAKLRIGAVDLGSHKTTALLGEVDQSGLIHVRGIGIAESRGVKQGAVTDLSDAGASLVTAVHLAEEMAEERMPPVCAGISGDHIQCINSDGGLSFSPQDPTVGHDIVPQDVERAVEASRSVQLPLDKSLLHAIPQAFTVDGQGAVPNPIGMVGFRLSVNTHLVLGAITSQSNLRRVIERAGLKLSSLVYSPLASSYAVLSREEKEMGTVLLDIGGGTVDAAFFVDGAIRYCWSFPYAGETLTRDLAVVLKTSMAVAERIKIEYGVADPHLLGEKDEQIEVPDVNGAYVRQYFRSYLASILSARLREILEHVGEQVEAMNLQPKLAAGLVITGGVSATPGLSALAGRVLGLPVRIAAPGNLLGISDLLHRGEHSTGVGLLLHAASSLTDLDRTQYPAIGTFDNMEFHSAAGRGGLMRKLGQLVGWR